MDGEGEAALFAEVEHTLRSGNEVEEVIELTGYEDNHRLFVVRAPESLRMPELPRWRPFAKASCRACKARPSRTCSSGERACAIPFLRVWPPSPVQRCRTFGVVRSLLLIDLDDGRVLLSHLGMSGRYTLFDSDQAASAKPLLQTVNGGVPVSAFGDETGHGGKHDHLEFIFTDGSRAVYTDPRRFGIIDLFPAEDEAGHKLLASLGPEPFDLWDAQGLGRPAEGSQGGPSNWPCWTRKWWWAWATSTCVNPSFGLGFRPAEKQAVWCENGQPNRSFG